MNAILSIVYAPVPGFPAGSVVASIVATITGSIAGSTPIVQTGTPGATSIEFANVAADTYTFSVAAEDGSGNTYGTAVTGSFTITAPATVTLSLPSSVSVAQS